MLYEVITILARSAVNVFRNIMSVRSERLADFSFLEYLNALLHDEDISDLPQPEPGFWAELDHLLRATVGRTHIYSDKVPAFLRYEGRRAAKLRSTDLSRMARQSQKFMARYACGLV